MRIYLFLAEGFEEIEAVTVIDVLRRAQIDVQTVSINNKKEVSGAHGITIISDILFDYDSLSDGEMLILPGGMPGTDNLYAHEGLASLIKKYSEKNRWLAAICAAPMVFGKMQLLNGKAATCFPGFEQDLKGAHLCTDRVVQDGKIITSRGAGTAMDFALKLVEILMGEELSSKLRDKMLC